METVENLVNISQPMIKEKNLEFSFHINRIEKEYLYTDQLRLNQIYINILSNAIKYTQPGGHVGVQMREEKAQEGFQPALDKDISCHIKVAGGYDNFEALEAEFDRFNEFYLKNCKIFS